MPTLIRSWHRHITSDRADFRTSELSGGALHHDKESTLQGRNHPNMYAPTTERPNARHKMNKTQRRNRQVCSREQLRPHAPHSVTDRPSRQTSSAGTGPGHGVPQPEPQPPHAQRERESDRRQTTEDSWTNAEEQESHKACSQITADFNQRHAWHRPHASERREGLKAGSEASTLGTRETS